MSAETHVVKCIAASGKKAEDSHFQEKDQEYIRQLREKAEKETQQKYCDEHKNHCFRCGTPSLIEVERDKVKIDICVNENCGAIHLDPGELDQILKDQAVIKNVRKAIFAVFK